MEIEDIVKGLKMFRSGFFCLLLLTFLILTDQSGAQDQMFSGRGFRTTPESNETTFGTGLSDVIDFSNDTKPESSRFRLFGQKPNADFWKSNPFRRESTESATGNLWGNMPSLFNKRDTNEPNLLDQFNAKSRGVIDRTAGWAVRQNENIRTRTFDTWDSITKNLKPIRSGQRTPQPMEVEMPPPVRTANSLDGRPKVRF